LISKSKSHKKQDDILKASCELFLERGYDAVRLDDILERVGGSKTTLYSYYGCKKGLFAATVQKVCRDKLGPLLAMDVTDMDPKAGLNAMGRQFLLIMSDPQGRAFFRAMIAEAQRFPELASAFFAARPETTLRLLRRNIEHWQETGSLRSGNPEVLASQFLGLMMGNFHLKSLLGIMEPMTERQIRRWVAQGTETFLDGTLPRKA